MSFCSWSVTMLVVAMTCLAIIIYNCLEWLSFIFIVYSTYTLSIYWCWKNRYSTIHSIYLWKMKNAWKSSFPFNYKFCCFSFFFFHFCSYSITIELYFCKGQIHFSGATVIIELSKKNSLCESIYYIRF